MAGHYRGMVDRRISTLLDTLSTEEPVIALHGPRSVGKSTVLRAFAEAHGVPVVDLDDLAVREAVISNPTSAVEEHTPVCLDEYQHAPDLLDAIKARLNRDGAQPGTAVLTGSTRQDAIPRTAQALTGRLHTMTIWPLSRGEVLGVREDLIEALRDDPEGTVAKHPTSTTTRIGYIDLVCAGGFPLAVNRTESGRSRWFDNYVTQSVERDALELVRIRQRQSLRDLLGHLAGRTGQILVLKNLNENLGLHHKTLEEYTKLLEDLYLVARLPAWGKTLRARVSTSPKIHVIDSGVAARLLRLTPSKLASLDPTALTEFGNLLETFVVGELRKQASWLNEPVTVGHWRTHDNDEVDFVIEFDDGRVLAFEVKAAERVPGKELGGLKKLRDALGPRFIAGVALSTGPRSYTFEDRIHVMPIDRLWRPVYGT